jgi:acyl dehydratase
LKTKASTYRYEDLEIGKVIRFTRKITLKEVEAFAKLSGDRNPLHIDDDYGRASKFKKNIVHGMLCASLFSTLVGMYCPGEKCLYLGQSLQFKLPLFHGETVEVRGTILEKFDALNIIKMRTEIIRSKDIIVTGEARVKVIDY